MTWDELIDAVREHWANDDHPFPMKTDLHLFIEVVEKLNEVKRLMMDLSKKEVT